MMRMTMNKVLASLGVAIGVLMFLALLPSGATLIFSLLTRYRGNDTVPFITYVFDIVCSALILLLQCADLTAMTFFLTLGRKKGILMSCILLFSGLLVNMLFAVFCMFLTDTSIRITCMYCLVTGMMFLTSALFLSVGRCEVTQ